MKTLIRLIGKPGSGKTTTGDLLQDRIPNSLHFSFGELLKQIQQTPPREGYTLDDRQRVNDFLKEKSKDIDVFIVDGNPYPPTNFDRRKQLDSLFDSVYDVNLLCSDETALARLESRGRELLTVEGEKPEDRITKFNTLVVPEIGKTKEIFNVLDLNTEMLTQEEMIEAILKHSKL